MTDKPNSPFRRVSASKAPPPINPIRVGRYTAPNAPPVPPPNWDKWGHMRDVELWEAVALSVNLEPEKLPVYLGAFECFGDDPFRICPQTFLDRLQVANSNCGISLGFRPVHKLKARCLVDLPAFGAWAVKLNIPNIPPALAAMAATATTVPVVMPAQTAATPALVVAEVAEDEPATPNWKMQIQTEATALCLRLRKSGANPTTNSIVDSMSKWCVDNGIMTDGGIHPSANYLRTHVLGGKYWNVPR